MVSHLFYYQLALLALLWLFLMVHLTWPKRSHHRASHAHQAQAQTLQRAHTVCWPDHQAPLCPV